MLPWLQSNFNFPLSGDVNQKIDPEWFFNTIPPDTGDSEIEKEVFFKVASYGKQLGIIGELLLHIAEKSELDENASRSFKALKKMNEKVDEIKTEKENRIREKAKRMVEKLKNTDMEAFKELMQECDRYR